MADREPNQYVQRANQFNRPRRTGKVDKEKNNIDSTFKAAVEAERDKAEHQSSLSDISSQIDRGEMQLQNETLPSSVPAAPIKPAIGKDEVRRGMEILRKYKQGKQNLEDRITRNEKWWKMRHWDLMQTEETIDQPKPASGWLFNTIISKHADYMDSFPTADILPREEDDIPEAKMLSSIIPVVMKQNEYKNVYSDEIWYKLKHGTGVYGVFWDSGKLNGLGDISIKSMDLLTIFWEPGVTDIQDSENVFTVELVSNSTLERQYPQCKDALSKTQDSLIKKYMYDENIDTTGKSAVVDWYYKKRVNGRETLQYIKFVDDIVLYATENEIKPPTRPQTQTLMGQDGKPRIDEVTGAPIQRTIEVPTGLSMAERGLYDHAKYPFVFDVLFPEAGMPVGFGFVDVCKNAQASIDIYNNAFEKNVQFVANPRYIVRNDGGVNEEEFKDPNKLLVHTDGNLGEDSFAPINTPTFINSNYINILDQKITEMKETAGNRDATTGGTAAGVTAASAIAAIQESAGKTSRDQIATSYEAHKKVVYFVIELIRQFYNSPRQFRIIGRKGEQEFTQYSNAGIVPQYQGVIAGRDMGYRLPVFDIEVKTEKESAYTQLSQNELALQFYNQGFFNPQYSDQALACIDMMEFQGKNTVVEKIQANGTMYQQMILMQQQMLQMAEMIDTLGKERGTDYHMAAQMADRINGSLGIASAPSGSDTMPETALGESEVTANARERAAASTTPR